MAGISTTPQAQHPLVAPAGCDLNWQEKIEKARQARETAKSARQGKPPVFLTHLSPSRANE